jgi:hypothetical protein
VDLNLIDRLGIPMAQVLAAGKEIYVEASTYPHLGDVILVILVIAVKRAAELVAQAVVPIVAALQAEKN